MVLDDLSKSKDNLDVRMVLCMQDKTIADDKKYTIVCRDSEKRL